MLHSFAVAENSTSTPTSASGLVVLSVSVCSEMFAIDVQSVREIHAWAPPASLPGAPPYVQGMLNVGGEIVPLVVLASRLGLPNTKPLAPVTVIVERDADVIGLVVDAVCDLHSISVEQLCVTPAGDNDGSEKLFRGVITLGDALMCLINVDSMLPTAAMIAAVEPNFRTRIPSPGSGASLDSEQGAVL